MNDESLQQVIDLIHESTVHSNSRMESLENAMRMMSKILYDHKHLKYDGTKILDTIGIISSDNSSTKYGLTNVLSGNKDGANIQFYPQNGGTGANTKGGNFTVDAGQGHGTGNGGSIILQTGAAETGTGGAFYFNCGGALTAGGNGGDMYINLGTGIAPGIHGKLHIVSGLGNGAIMNFDSLTTDKTFIFNDDAGGVVVASSNTTTTAPTTTATPSFTSYYGGNTKALGDPNAWIKVKIGSTNYKIPLYT